MEWYTSNLPSQVQLSCLSFNSCLHMSWGLCVEICTCQKVNKGKATADKQHAPWLWPLLTAFAKIMHSCIEIQYGGQEIILFRTFPPPQQDLFKKTVSSITFLKCPWVRSLLFVFRKDRHCKFLFLLSPSSLDLINIISTYLDSRSNESSRRNLADKLANFAGC